MDMNPARSIIENILFIADSPITIEKIGEVFNGEMNKGEIKKIMDELKTDYNARGIQLVEIAEGYQLCTREEYAEWIKKFYKIDKGSKLSQASLETLSIIAYKQPITRVELEEIRGVDSGGVVRTLLEKNLIKNMGRKKVPGRPMMYGTTRKFLEYFGLKSLSDLPTLEEFKDDIQKGDMYIKEERAQGELSLQQKIRHEESEIYSESDEAEDIDNSSGGQGESDERE
ncbi:MAG TPA: SMC-Scp complex subunit ScpB [Nitrospinae bacterium]|nr:SMC-Scp complex subunit ScpB [Nitrospinota bacterium]